MVLSSSLCCRSHPIIQKNKPRKGTETVCRRCMERGANLIQKNKPRKGTETLNFQAARIKYLFLSEVQKNKPRKGTETTLLELSV